jgi:selenocysteine lyase/cysteine desulfurase
MWTIHANTAGVGELHPAAAAVMRQLYKQMVAANFYLTVYPRLLEYVEEARVQIGRLLGVEARTIALLSSTTEAVAALLAAFPWNPGDLLVLSRAAFVSVRTLVERLRTLHQLRVGRVGDTAGWVSCADLEAQTPPPRLVLVDWVSYASGVRNDIAALAAWCRARDIPLVIDGVQGLGAADIDFDLGQLAGFACAGHKWLHGPEGTGFLYVSPWFLPMLTPMHAGSRSLVDPEDLEPAEIVFSSDARKFEISTINHIGFAGLAAVVRDFCTKGLRARIARVQVLHQAMYELLAADPGIDLKTPREQGRSAGIMSFRHRRWSQGAVRQRILANGIVAVERCGLVRLSPSADVPVEEFIKRLSRALGIRDRRGNEKAVMWK